MDVFELVRFDDRAVMTLEDEVAVVPKITLSWSSASSAAARSPQASQAQQSLGCGWGAGAFCACSLRVVTGFRYAAEQSPAQILLQLGGSMHNTLPNICWVCEGVGLLATRCSMSRCRNTTNFRPPASTLLARRREVLMLAAAQSIIAHTRS